MWLNSHQHWCVFSCAPQVSDVRERRYEASGLGSLYLFRVDDQIVVDATKRASPHAEV